MYSDENAYDQIILEMSQLKQRMDEMIQENHALRQQLADLRDGHGIFIDIHGRRYALLKDENTLPIQEAAPAHTIPAGYLAQLAESAAHHEPQPHYAPQNEFLPPADPGYINPEEQTAQAFAPTPAQDLEDGALNELNDVTRPVSAIHKPPPQTAAGTEAQNEQQPADEDSLAALRRELIGSFLLE